MNKLLDRIVYKESLEGGLEDQFRRIFQRRPDILNEKLDCCKNLNSLVYKIGQRILSFLVDLASLDLVPGDKENRPIHKTRFMAKNPFGYGRQEQRTLQLLRSFGLIYLFYLILKFTFLGSIGIYRDYLRSIEGPKSIGVNDTNVEKCRLRDDLESNQILDSIRSKVKFLDGYLDLFGYPFSFNDAGPISIFIIVIFTIDVTFVSIFFIGKRGIQPDSQAFIRSPLDEIERVEDEFRNIVDKLAKTVNNYLTNIRSRELHGLLHSTKTNNRKQAENLRTIYLAHNSRGSLQFKPNYFQMLFNISANNLMIPHNYTSKAHMVMCGLNLFYFFIGFTETAFGVASLVIVLPWIEVSNRVSVRLESLECQQWHPMGSYISVNILQPPELTDPSQILAYQSYSNQTDGVSFGELMWIELRNSLNLRILVSCMEFAILIMICGFLGTLYTILFYQNQMFRGIWARDITMQLNSIMLKLVQENNKPKEEITDRLMLNRCLLITYMNIELFKKTNQNHQQLSLNIIMQVVLMTVTTMSLSYIAATYFNAISAWFLASLALASVVIMNIFLLSAVAVLTEIGTMFKSINKLIVRVSFFSLENSHVMDLFRRLVLSEKEFELFYALSFLTFKVSYDNVVYLNFYMALLWILTRSNHD